MSDDCEPTTVGALPVSGLIQGSPGSLTVAEVLSLEILRDAVVLGGRRGLGRPVERLNVMSVPNILPWAKANEFMLSTGFPLPRTADALAGLVRGFASQELSAFGIKFGPHLLELPEKVVEVADEWALPVVRIPQNVGFDDILGTVFSEIVNRQTAALTRAQEIHDSFLQIVLAGGQLVDIASKLSELLGGAVVAVLDEVGQVLTSTLGDEGRRLLEQLGLLDSRDRMRIAELRSGSHHHLASGTDYVVAPVQAGSLRHGDILAVGRGTPLDHTAVVATEQAAVVVALDRTRQVAISAVARQFEASILHDIITRRDPVMNDALPWAPSLDWDFDRALVVIVSSIEWPGTRAGTGEGQLVQQLHLARWAAEVWRQDPHAAAVAFADELVAVVGVGRSPDVVPWTVWRGLKEATGNEFSFGVSRVFDSQGGIPQAYEEARTALRIGLRMEGPGHVTSFDGLGLFRLLSLVDDRAELRAFVEDTLGGLLHHDQPGRGDLLRTLEVLLDVHLNVAAAARELHFHYNTMRYRISKLEGLIGPFTRDSRLALQISVALQALGMPEFGEG
ncbi:MAG: PucR family transcriptional regulator [Acidimicrobiales bacterium]